MALRLTGSIDAIGGYTASAQFVGTATNALELESGSFTTTFTNVSELTASHNLGTKSVGVFAYGTDDFIITPYNYQTFDNDNVHINFISSSSGRVVVIK